jgi:hypothetical protein
MKAVLNRLLKNSGLSMLTNPLVYTAIIALCALVREIVRCHYHLREFTFLLKMTHDPGSLQYLAQLEEARRTWSTTKGSTAQASRKQPSLSPFGHGIVPAAPVSESRRRARRVR